MLTSHQPGKNGTTITAGSTVTWTNNDTVSHIVSFGDQEPQSSDVNDPGGTFSATAGVYVSVDGPEPLTEAAPTGRR